VTSIDAAIDRLDAALRAADLDGLTPPQDLGALDALVDVIPPYELPPDLRRFWERVDPTTLAVEPWPELLRPQEAGDRYRDDRQYFPLGGPPLLLPIAAHSDARQVVELKSNRSAGGTIFYSDADPGFRIQYRGVVDFVEVLAEAIEDGAIERRGGFNLLDERVMAERAATRLRGRPTHPLYGEALDLPADPAGWPAHWLLSAGIRLEDREPLGATHTISELIGAAARGPVRGRIAGEVVRLVSVGNDCHVVVEDESGRLRVFCPAGVSPWGPSHRSRFEFQVTLAGRPAAPDLDTGTTAVQRHALRGNLAAAGAAMDAFVARIESEGPVAIASAIRPLD
jgi:hypothetical protein